jgi:hypothetical protein
MDLPLTDEFLYEKDRDAEMFGQFPLADPAVVIGVHDLLS